MAMIRDPNWNGPGRGPLIDDGMADPVTPAPVAKPEPGYGGPGPGVRPEPSYGDPGFGVKPVPVAKPEPGYGGPGPGVAPGSVVGGGGGGGGGGKTVVSRVQQGSGRSRVVVITYSDGTTETLADPNIGEETGRSYRGTGKNRIRITTWTDGTFTEEADPEDDSDDDGNDDDDEDDTPKFDEDSFGKLKELLGRLGLGSLTTNVRDLIAKGVLGGDAILFELRETPEFKTRFAGNAARVKAGLPELRPLVYVALEAQYRETMKANGLNVDLYDETKDFQALIEGDVSNAELQRRIVNGYRAVSEADPEVVRQMQELYNVTPGQLAQYFLDPANTEPVLTKQAAAAAVAARGKEQGKLQLGKLTAEDLVNRGYSEAQAMAAFKILGEQKGLYEEMSGESALTEGQKVGSVFGYDVDSVEAVKKRQATRKSPFLGGGSYTKSTGQTSGTVQTGLGVAE